MTWLKGTSTLGAIPGLLTQLACGEVADGLGNTCAGGDQWVREAGGLDAMRSPASVDVVTADWAMRTGYFSLCSVPNATHPGLNANVAGTANSCAVTTHFTSNPATSAGRWFVTIRVVAANTVPGDYSTATVYWSVNDPDYATGGRNFTSSGGAVALTSGGVITTYAGMEATLADPSGTLTAGTTWFRAFTTDYTYGIDCWPFWPRRGNGTTTPTWTTAPPGVLATDFNFVDQVSQPSGFADPAINANADPVDSLSLFSGLGIKTAMGLGSRYVGHFPLALLKARIYSTASNGVYGIDAGPSILDTFNGNVIRVSGGGSQLTWLQCIKSSGSASSSTVVQYWMSVKATGIYVVLNADTGATGRLGTAYIGKFSPYDTTHDVLPTMVSAIPIDYTIDSYGDSGLMYATTGSYWRTRRCSDASVAAQAGTATGSSTTTLTDSTATRTTNADAGLFITAGSSTAVVVSNTATAWTVASWAGGTPSSSAVYSVGRDWQTGWMRTDFTKTIGTGYPLNWTYYFSAPPLNDIGVSAIASGNTMQIVPASQAKPNWDGNWWLYGWEYAEYWAVDSTPGSANEQTMIRGYSNDRFLVLPAGGWGNGDELTDTNTGAKYFCLMPDYAAAAFKNHYGSNLNGGGVAVVEI